MQFSRRSRKQFHRDVPRPAPAVAPARRIASSPFAEPHGGTAKRRRVPGSGLESLQVVPRIRVVCSSEVPVSERHGRTWRWGLKQTGFIASTPTHYHTLECPPLTTYVLAGPSLETLELDGPPTRNYVLAGSE